MKRILTTIAATLLAFGVTAAQAAPEQYKLDTAHTFITFKTSHIGFSWMPGVFHDFSGTITYDPEDRAASSTEFTVQTESVDTFHAERNKHLRERDGLFETGEFPTAKFVSTSYEPTGPDSAKLTGELTIKGNTHTVEFKVQELAARKDPWGNFRRAFSASATINLADFGLTYFADNNIPEPKTAEINISVEALRQ
ncbi:Protein YceI [wastewater metagenome]|uniref:Protein YceI n=2 Tax=unclassified sequences TaxID=12908 RepID=A0A5B8R7C6_9ZZZZ|nr:MULTISPECIES: YceI family protein [Arhodomonas]MCS4505215.1 YceI family protein [Arhodomonas aquaeolei]QEA04999.1 protein YceI [uncultured organism]